MRLTARTINSTREMRNAFGTQQRNEGYVSLWQVRVRAAESWNVAAGRDVLNWGAGQFRSPSSPFYFDNGRTDPDARTGRHGCDEAFLDAGHAEQHHAGAHRAFRLRCGAAGCVARQLAGEVRSARRRAVLRRGRGQGAASGRLLRCAWPVHDERRRDAVRRTRLFVHTARRCNRRPTWRSLLSCNRLRRDGPPRWRVLLTPSKTANRSMPNICTTATATPQQKESAYFQRVPPPRR